MPRVLYITEISPFPTWGGDRIRARYILECLDELGYETTALVTNKDEYDLSTASFRNVRLVSWQPADNSLSQSVLKYLAPDRNLLATIHNQIKQDQFDAAFIDSGFLGQYIRPLKAQGLKVIYGTHNAQADLTRQTPARSQFHGLKLRAAARLQRWHEGHFFGDADHVIVVSREDLEYHADMMPREKLVVLPNFLNLDDYEIEKKEQDTVVISGNFRAYQNRVGAQWLLDEIWDETLAGCAQLVIVGRGSKDFFARYDGARGVRIVGEVKAIQPYISSAKLALVPLLHGSGTRLKCLEAMALGTAVVATTIGAEGVEHQGAITNADTATEFRTAILELLNDPARRRGKATLGLNTMQTRYSSAVAKRILSNLIGDTSQFGEATEPAAVSAVGFG